MSRAPDWLDRRPSGLLVAAALGAAAWLAVYLLYLLIREVIS